ncbi:MAG TPA: glycoside hydrolase family 2 TIM barrel-domain containing protein [Dysgonamonadaceae bacterium]|nr:glycoside hydrolase family 2 TIM barrel-domain containing protein [Dysgonamonadaceae bacterium]
MKMKAKLLVFIGCLMSFSTFAQWQPAGDKIKTRWASEIDVNNVLPEYPRPIMERAEWQNLNGLWDYAILPVGRQTPSTFDGKILVPFAIESSLSGVQKKVGKENELWYQREFTVPSKWKNNRILLHFGAVDWKADIWVNDIKVGHHTGGYTPFSFDITSALKSGSNKLVVKVWDPTNDSYQPRGKQVNRPEGIWYTSVTGIWQTVWLEPVSEKYFTNVKITPDIDNKKLIVVAETNDASVSDKVEVKVMDGSKVVASGRSINHLPVEITMPDEVKLWSPDSPFLYDLEITLWSDNKPQDKVKSYAAMRKYSIKRDDKGIVRLQLNNKDMFQFGPLDQGWWPDGLYTAPTDDALKFDIQKTKDFGFNMIRKHVKVEPARWYMHCDRLGMIVWQDMPSGDRGPQWQPRQYFNGVEWLRSPESEANYRKEWKEIIDFLYSYPCVGVWVPFNEAWGQFKTKEIAEWTKQYDPSRLVNPASGGNHYPVGDILDLHNYPQPELYLYDGQRATVLGEYGGIGWAVKGHLWEPDRNWGYVQFNSSKEVTDEYVKYAGQLKELIKHGFSAAVYTQTTDVEVEVNGLMTYDREVIKMDEQRIKQVNSEICNILKD